MSAPGATVPSDSTNAGAATPLSQPLQNGDHEVAVPTLQQKYAKALNRGRWRAVVVCFWVAMLLGCIVVRKAFMNALKSDVPPTKGTQSAEAKDVFQKYFPSVPLNGAFFMQSSDGRPILDFIPNSTCGLKYKIANLQQIQTAKSIDLQILSNNSKALGGGCLLTKDIEPALQKVVTDMCSTILPLFMNESQASTFQKMILANLSQVVPGIVKSMPNITACPNHTALTNDYLNFTGSIQSKLESELPGYTYKVASFKSLNASTVNKSGRLPSSIRDKLKAKGLSIETLNVSLIIPAGELWQLFQSQFWALGGSAALAALSTTDPSGVLLNPVGAVAKSVGNTMNDIANEAPGSLVVEASAMGSLLEVVQQGIQVTMDVSAATVPLALVILAVIVKNLRVLVLVLTNLLINIAAAIFIMYPFTQFLTVSTMAPALLVALSLAMSIDYSLFLLSRFQKEIAFGRDVPDAVEVMLSTSGRIVFLSGFTLFICFLMMLTLPVAFIYTQGVSAAITVMTAVCVALTMTPTMLLSFPEFFSHNRRWGLTSDGCSCCKGDARSPQLGNGTVDQPATGDGTEDCIVTRQASAAEADLKQSCWPRFGSKIQMGAWVVALALIASMIPVAVTSLPRFVHSVGVIPLMPRGATATKTIMGLQAAFGVGSVFPTQLVVVPPPNATLDANRAAWLESACHALENVAVEVNNKLDPSANSLPQFTKKAFVGAMMLDGKCTGESMGKGLARWSNVEHPYSATIVMLNYQIDPFTGQGQQWVTALREAFNKPEVKKVASWYIDGSGPVQMDASNLTFDRLPLTVGLMMVVVFVVIAIAFKSVVAACRAVFCLMWMLVLTVGMSIYIFQDGCFDFLNWPMLAQRASGGMSWLAPSTAFPMMVGLGLDYDIFYSERVLEEWMHGYSEKDSAVRALGATANTISAAGLIMVLAFIALVLGATPALNEIGFMLVLGVAIDCFITTKIIIPCSMALLGKKNFWPRKQPFERGPDSGSTVAMVRPSDP